MDKGRNFLAYVVKGIQTRVDVALLRAEHGRCSEQGSVLAAEVGLGGV